MIRTLTTEEEMARNVAATYDLLAINLQSSDFPTYTNEANGDVANRGRSHQVEWPKAPAHKDFINQGYQAQSRKGDPKYKQHKWRRQVETVELISRNDRKPIAERLIIENEGIVRPEREAPRPSRAVEVNKHLSLCSSHVASAYSEVMHSEEPLVELCLVYWAIVHWI
jgi:hypothetical protein